MEDEQRLKIEAYITGILGEEEARHFEKEIANNEELRKQTELARHVSHHLSDTSSGMIPDNKYVADLRDYLNSPESKELKEQLASISNRYHQEKSRHPIRRTLSIAASILFLLSVSIYWLSDQKSSLKFPLYNQYYSDEDLPSFTKRGNTDSPHLQEGIASFHSKDYELAQRSLIKYFETEDEPDVLVHLYLGQTYVMSNDIEKAIEHFTLVESAALLESPRGTWFKALAYMKDGEVSNAKKSLTMLAKNPSGFKNTESKMLLERLNGD